MPDTNDSRTKSNQISGHVLLADGTPAEAVVVRAFKKTVRREQELGQTKADGNGHYEIRFSSTGSTKAEAEALDLVVKVFAEDDSLLVTSATQFNAGPVVELDLIIPTGKGKPGPAKSSTYHVTGRVTSPSRPSVGGLRVLIVDKNIGSDVKLAEVTTSDDGSYLAEFSFTGDKEHPDLQARVYSGETFLGASDVRYNASQTETLNIELTEEASANLPAEYETLIKELTAHFAGDLRDLKENDERQDITYLANKTGWDARAVAFAALADRFSAQTASAKVAAPAIAPAFFYALLRAGISTTEDAIYQADTQSVVAIWNQAISQGVIPATFAEAIPKAIEHFHKTASQRALDFPAMAGASPLRELLSVSQIKRKDQQQQFADIYTRHRNDPAEFWKAVRDAFGEAVEKRLELDGQLARLTLNNAPLMQKLISAVGRNKFSDIGQLVDHGFFRAESWAELIDEDKVPSVIEGADEKERKQRFAELLSAQVRLSFPTAVVAQMVKGGETALSANDRERPGNGGAKPTSRRNLPKAVHAFLTKHQGEFNIGAQPVARFIQNNSEISSEAIDGVDLADVTAEITRIQRVYQITPSDKAMNALLNKGVDSAHAVVRYSESEFVETFKDDLGGEADAKLTYAKAQQVHFATLNITTSYLLARNAPSIGGNGSQFVNPATTGLESQENGGDVIAYPTLEGLFGEMDYCECEHCRSILSPAAYLVDLLKFIDPEPAAWNRTLKRWRTEHDAPYPLLEKATGENEGSSSVTASTPLEVLLSKRPDIQYLPLTCENTNVPLPYIDVVNETLEYYVTDGLKFEEYTGHSTDPEVKSEELLANPQFVSDAAYEKLNGEFFPPPLPFHRTLENLRRYFEHFKLSLPQVMEVLRKNDNLDRFNETYGWRDILMEELGLSRAEHKVLTNYDPDPPLNAILTLQRLYGYDDQVISESNVIAILSHAKTFTRRVGISYEELMEVLKTRFVNPSLSILPLFERLGLSVAQLKDLKEDSSTGEAWLAHFRQALGDKPFPDASKYDGDIEKWVKNADNFLRITRLVTLTTPIVPRENSTAYRLGDYVRPSSLPAGSSTFYECISAGTSASTEPNKWPPEPGETLQDGGVVWTTRLGVEGNFDTLRFRYHDPAKLRQDIQGLEFIRILRFIRLWKKLGWTIEQTDKAIAAYYPENQVPNDPDETMNRLRLDAGFLTLLPRLAVFKRIMKALSLKPEKDLSSLLVCDAWFYPWGVSSLYRQLFLSPALLKLDNAFADDGYGNFLQQATVSYKHQQATLEPAILKASSGLLSYDHTQNQLSYTGPFPAAKREAIKAVSNVTPTFQKAIDALYAIKRLLPHTETLRGAFQLTDDELVQIMNWLGVNSDTELSLEIISSIFRLGWLPRKLKLSVREFLLLIQLTGLNLYAPLDPSKQQILPFIEFVAGLGVSGLRPVELLYFLWNHDITGKLAPEERQVFDLAARLRSDFSVIESEFSVADDPVGSVARARMSLVYGDDVTELFFGLLENTLVTEVSYDHAPDAVLEEAILKTANHRIGYDHFRKRLSIAGVLTTKVRDDLKAVPNVTTEFQVAVTNLYEENQKVVAPFFGRYPELLPLHDAFVFFGDLKSTASYSQSDPNLQAVLDASAGRLSYDPTSKEICFKGVLTQHMHATLLSAGPQLKEKLDSLFSQNQEDINGFFETHVQLKSLEEAYLGANDSLEDRRTVLLSNFLPELKQRRKRRRALEIVSTETKTDLEFAAALLDDALVLNAATDENRPALDDIVKIETPGLFAQFFFRDTATGDVNQTSYAEANLSYSPGTNALPENEGKPISGIWSGYIEAPESNFFNFQIDADAGAKVTLTVDGVAVTLVAGNGTVWTNTEPIELRAGSFHAVTLKVEQVKEKLSVRWQPKGRGLEFIPPQRLYLPTLQDLKTLASAGFSAKFFFRDTATGNVDLTSDSQANLAYSDTGTNKLPTNGNVSGIWSGYIEAPQNTLLSLTVQAGFDSTVSLDIGAKHVELLRSGHQWWIGTPIFLRAGTLYPISLKVEKVRSLLQIDWTTTGLRIIPERYLSTPTFPDRLWAAYLRFLKAAALSVNLKLTTSETTHFATHADYKIDGRGWLNSLPIIGQPDDDLATRLFKVFSALLDFTRIRAELGLGDEQFLSILKNPVVSEASGLLFALTRWNPSSFNALQNHFRTQTADLTHLNNFRQLHEAYKPVRAMGASAATLIEATTNEPTLVTIHNMQAALRARYDSSGWLALLKPINDELRIKQRNALVVSILNQMSHKDETKHIDTPEKLFEYFLMDVQMDCCMQTSRIRHAISSVQLFIDRCLMNLEPRVSPWVINAKQWEWMQRYRVWEANRKVFIWPENWLESELRDDQSPFFKETMSELLQSDITDDRATAALLTYLSKLEEVAKLEPCGIQYIENDPGTADDIAHVVARTAGAKRKYFYRRREYGYWTPWEQIPLDIEDNPVIPVVWHGRLLLFWFRILQQPIPTPPTIPPPPNEQLQAGLEIPDKPIMDLKTSEVISEAPVIYVQAILCWSEYYNGKWQPTKTSDINNPVIIGANPDPGFQRSELMMVANEESGSLRVVFWDNILRRSFRLFNTHSVPLVDDSRFNPFAHMGRWRVVNIDTGTLGVTYTQSGPNMFFDRHILTNTIDHRVTHRVLDDWYAPLFYEDGRHVFYVTTTAPSDEMARWDRYGLTPAQPPRHAIPPIMTNPGVIVGGRAPVERFISERGHISRVIRATDTVRYRDSEIGPAGFVSDGQMRHR